VRYAFDAFLMDTRQYELRRAGEAVHVEPLVFDLLRLFVENPGAVIDRDRMIAEVWDGRSVSDATLSTAIKSARRALGDSGEAQTFIQTVRGRGFRFAGPVSATQPAEAREPGAAANREADAVRLGGRPSIAVLPFTRLGATEPYGGLEDAIPHEIILALSRLHWLFVIARGSAFQFRGAGVDVGGVGRALRVRYCLTGTLEIFGKTLAAAVELADTTTGGVIWGNRFAGALDDVHAVRAEIVGGIIAALEVQIPLNEAMLAQERAPENLDAWQAFHLGLKQMHRYTRDGNAAAEGLFRRAIALEPGFARAHAGLSFTHFQNAFMRYLPDREAEIAAAQRAAETGLELDPLDPFSNFSMGRSFWLQKDLDSALPWLERATSISPNYAQGIYSRAMVDTMSGRSLLGLRNVDLAMQLSPLDPLLYAMRAAKALARITDGDFPGAAQWGDAAARTPRAHVIIEMIAMVAHALAGDDAVARRWAASVRRRMPDASQAYFFDALPMQHPQTRRRIEQALVRLGF
jgi:DNA-binding winged helix-turn-helix (wHTH) protein